MSFQPKCSENLSDLRSLPGPYRRRASVQYAQASPPAWPRTAPHRTAPLYSLPPCSCSCSCSSSDKSSSRQPACHGDASTPTVLPLGPQGRTRAGHATRTMQRDRVTPSPSLCSLPCPRSLEVREGVSVHGSLQDTVPPATMSTFSLNRPNSLPSVSGPVHSASRNRSLSAKPLLFRPAEPRNLRTLSSPACADCPPDRTTPDRKTHRLSRQRTWRPRQRPATPRRGNLASA